MSWIALTLLFGLVYGAWLFRERMLGQNLIAAAIMLAGVALLTGMAG